MSDPTVKEDALTKEKTLICIAAIMLTVIAAIIVTFVVYGGMYMFVPAELGAPPPEARIFLRGSGDAVYVGLPDDITDTKGIRSLRVSVDGKERTVFFIVKDTTPPTADAAVTVIWTDETVSAGETVTDIRDASKVTVKWLTEPPFGTVGTHKAEVELRDKSGNTATVSVEVRIIAAVESFDCPLYGKAPDVNELVPVKHESAEYITDVNALDFTKLCEYPVKLTVDGMVCETVLRVVDVAPPEIVKLTSAVSLDEKPEASDFVLRCSDDTEVTYSFKNLPVYSSVGEYPCSVCAADEYGNETVFDTVLYVCDRVIVMEAGREPVTDAKLFGKEFKGYTIAGGSFVPDKLGGNTVTLTKGDKSLCLGVIVRDTAAPQVTGSDVYAFTGYPHELTEFYSEPLDAGSVSVKFTAEPDWYRAGEQAVDIEFTDNSGNSTVLHQKAIVSDDAEGPVICGERSRYCYVGDAVAYFKEVCAYDNADPEPTLTVDKSAVNPREPGEYTVTYTATDRDGNVSTADVIYIFREKTVSDEELDALADKVLSEIITSDMSLAQKIYAVHDYAYSHILYNGVSDKTDWKAEAYRGITEGIGDCFTFYSTTYLLMSKLDGVEVMSVQRLNGATRHYWCLVNIGTGWYHLDACNVGPNHMRVFMKTDAELEAISTYFWRYDKSLYPAGATEAFELN